MFKKIIFILLSLASFKVYGNGWDAPATPISVMFVYPDYVVVVQEGNYSGTGCAPGYVWSFAWSDFDSATQQRIYSTLLAAKLSRTPIKPIIAMSGCGPEGKLRFNGQFVM